MELEPSPYDVETCERCSMRPAAYFLERGIYVCYDCYQNPEDIRREL